MTSSDTRISVALCTFNGAEYLGDQLWSIAEQSLTPFELVICDDRSSDGTLGIIERFKLKSDCPVRIYQNSEQIGVLKNFTKAISLCEGDYIALSDQDDIWLPDKLGIAYMAVKKAEAYGGKGIPLLVHSDLKVVNSDGVVIAESFIRQNRITSPQKEPMRTLLVQNYVTGCTVLMNRSLVEVALPIPEEALMHDWWLALIAASLGEIIYLPDATVLYRQHSGNVIGSRAFFSISNFLRLVDIPTLELEIAALVKQSVALKKHLSEKPDYFAPVYLDRLLEAAQRSGFRTALVALIYKIKKYPWTRNIFFMLLLLKGGYLRFLRSSTEMIGEE